MREPVGSMDATDGQPPTQLGILQGLVDLAKQQGAAFAAGDLETAVNLVSQRKILLERWTVSEVLRNEDLALAHELASRLSALDGLIEHEFETALAEAGRDLSALRRGRHAYRAYHGQQDVGSKLLDGKR